ncbi:MAG: ATP-binding protein [Butyrivibrio sp.]|nr:ATP-binding protein [Butyrivibrio sp.]
MNFLNREKQRSLLKQCLDKIQHGIEQCIWVEGSSGTGKTYFVKYMKKQENPPVFCFDDYSWLYKCNSNDINKEFSYIIALVSDFQIKHPNEFNNYLINYFNKIYSTSWVEVLVHLIPNIKFTEWAKGIVNYCAEDISNAKSDISSRLYSQGLPKFFAELILYMLNKVEKREKVLFCIDDACWLDDNSIKTINIILNMLLFSDVANFKISFAIITRRKEELEYGTSNYEILENILKDYFGTLEYIYVKNFDIETTKKYVELMNKTVILEKSTSIYRITNGNPQELYQALKIDSEDLLELCERQSNNTINMPISNELVFNFINKNLCVLPILASISLVHTTIPQSWLPILVQSICNKVHISFSSSSYDESVVLLEENDLISNKKNKMIIGHDSIKEIIRRFLQENGEYTDYIDAIAGGLEICSEPSDVMKDIFYLYADCDPKKCFNFFVKNHTSGNTLDADIYKVVIGSLIKDCSIFTHNNLNNIIVPIIIKECAFLSLYDDVYEICRMVYYMMGDLTPNIMFQYLALFSKVLIEMARLDMNQQFNAISIINEALQIENLSADARIEAHLLAMSAYEHILDFDDIMKNNIKATKIYLDYAVSDYLKAMYLRNQGLVKSHIELKRSYEEAISYAEDIDDIRQKNLMLGTCHNNLGLSYWYSNDLANAKTHFYMAKQYLENIGYDIFRVLNNISMCYLLEGDLSKAYKYLLQAKVLNIDCIFEKLCIQSNLAIIEWKLGKKESAKQISLDIYNEYINNNKQTADELIYSSVMVNLGYFSFCDGNYLDAANKYKESQFFKYRYNNEEQLNKRQAMIEICLSKINLLPSKEIDMDIDDKGQDIFKCMYAPISFAYYVI